MFKNLVTLVTGGAAGLGRATATRLVNKGTKVVFCDLPTSNGAEVAKELGDNALYIPADITSTEDIQNVLDEIKNKHGKLDVLVNCAGLSNAFVTYNFTSGKPRSIEDFQRVLMTNVIGTFNVTRLAVGLIGENEPDHDGLRGVVVNTSGVEAFNGSSGQVATAAAGGAIHSITQPMALDFGERGIRVVTIAPGIFRTQLADHFPTNAEEAIANECMVSPHRFGYPDEFAHVVQSVIANPYLNATTIEVSAGLNLNM